MKVKVHTLLTSAILTVSLHGQTQNYFGNSGTLTGAVWSTAVGGPYTSALDTTGGAIINFGNAASFTGASIIVAGINATANATATTIGGTISNFGNSVIPVSVASGVTLDFAGQSFTSSATAGYIKNGDGTLSLAGNTYGGGFTLNAGTVAAGGANAMGDGGSLTINGGAIRSTSTANRDFSNKFDLGITIAGNFTLGNAVNNGALTFNNNVALGAANRTITSNSTATFSGIISGSSGVGIIKEGTGALILAGTNTFNGGITVNAGTLSFRTTAAKTSGGTYTFGTGTVLGLGFGTGGFTALDIQNAFAGTFTGSLAGISIGASNNIAIDTAGLSTFSANIGPSTRGLEKIENAGNLTLTGANQYSGRTVVGGGNALVVNSLGNKADASSNIGTNGTIDLLTNGRIDHSLAFSSDKDFNVLGSATFFGNAGLSATLSGTVSTETAGLKTFTISGNTGAASHIFSGNIADGSGQLALTKSGASVWTLSSANNHTGATTMGAGTLILSHSSALQNSPLNTTGSAAGSATAGLRTTVATVTLGGLTGDKNFGALFNTSTGAYNTVTGLTLNPVSGATYSYAAVIANGASGMTLTKTGLGTQTLSGTNLYTGATGVNAGKLATSGTGSINTTSAINVAVGAGFVHNSSVALTVAPTLNGTGTLPAQRATLSGTGPINATLALNNIGDVLSPGNSPGIMPFTTGQIWASNSYDWEINSWSAAVAGTNIDQITIVGTLDLSAITANQYMLNILSLTTGNVSGDVDAFSEISKSWTILTTSGGITGFNTTEWMVNAGGFSNGETGIWSVALGNSDKDIVLSYTAVPEPNVAALLGGVGALILLRRRRLA